MLGINLHRNLQEMKRPNRSGRASTLNGQLPLDRAADTTKQSMVGALVRTPLARQGETEPQSEQWNHVEPDRGMSWSRAPKIRYLHSRTTTKHVCLAKVPGDRKSVV